MFWCCGYRFFQAPTAHVLHVPSPIQHFSNEKVARLALQHPLFAFLTCKITPSNKIRRRCWWRRSTLIRSRVAGSASCAASTSCTSATFCGARQRSLTLKQRKVSHLLQPAQAPACLAVSWVFLAASPRGMGIPLVSRSKIPIIHSEACAPHIAPPLIPTACCVAHVKGPWPLSTNCAAVLPRCSSQDCSCAG